MACRRKLMMRSTVLVAIMAVVGWICVLKWSYLFGTAQISSDTRRPHRFKPKGHIWAANTSGEPLRAPVNAIGEASAMGLGHDNPPVKLTSEDQGISVGNDAFIDEAEASAIEVVEATEQIDRVMEHWVAEKSGFYRDELGMDESMVDEVQAMAIKTGNDIQAVVAALTATPPKITEDDYQFAIQRLHDEEEQAVKRLVGEDRHKKMRAFRTSWNAEIDARFGVRMKVTGF